MGIPSTDWKIVAKPLFRVDMVLIGFESFTNDQLAENLVCLENRGRVMDQGSGAATPKTTSPEPFDTIFFDDDLIIEVQTSDFQF